MEKGKTKIVNYEPVIGLEVHVELNTESKMFCSCSADYFGKEPNTHTCPVCLALPGALPYINEEAINDCIKIGLALNCTVADKSLFERKNYFYPDLPKGYQISQYRWPLTVNGWIEVVGQDGKTKKIRINRAHQEEDTGKLTHKDSNTLIDFNRSGVPLVEIVTEPDFSDTTQIVDYAKKLQQIFRYLEVSNADMERGDMRLEANISVRPVGQTTLPNYRVELKNINSFRFMMAAVEYEIKRQIAALEKGERLQQETRGWNEDKKETFLQRVKEEANDYRYFPEPDLPKLKISENQINQIKSELPELPVQKSVRFQKEFGLRLDQILVLIESSELSEFYERAVEVGRSHHIDPKIIANFIINRKINIEETAPTEIIEQILESKAGIVEDPGQIEGLAAEVISENPQIAADFKKGKETALQALIGAGMKKRKGKVSVEILKSTLENLLQKE
ncbi:MAG: Asp-tRNA(Asn)/Glu-tRNA(Gln) amidotransferase subunit GatB [Candidatus Daviesbacteria bacterium]|nr:MAG: Asp-tRNA(Asn)/Glu-tRNA(Gln) amidotransferase subunit GatB [Candidatus Daviesbacteria bacterium]